MSILFVSLLALALPCAWGMRDDRVRGAYQAQNSTLTLREGLADYFKENGKYTRLSYPDGMEDLESAIYFRNHDATHVIFGTHTGDINEGIAHNLHSHIHTHMRTRDKHTWLKLHIQVHHVVCEHA
jgi:hypothetical protein